MARLLALLVLLSSSAASAQIWYGDDPAHFGRPDLMSLASGLLDRTQLSLARGSIGTEVGSLDGARTATTTFHAQLATPSAWAFGAYFTLPLAYALDEPLRVAARGGPVERPSRLGFRTADLGVFLGAPDARHRGVVWRVGALLPTASTDGPPSTISARAGDMVLELPRSAGARFSASHVFGALQLPGSWFGTKSFGGLRVDTGLDVAYELDAQRMHLVPHAGVGAMVAFRRATVSLDSVVAMDPTDRADMRVRWSTGVTGRFAPTTGLGSWFQPGVTLAMVRTPDGWGGTIALELAASRYRDAARRD